MHSQSQKTSFWYRNGLTLFFLFLFFITLVGQGLTGWKEHNQQLQDNAGTPLSLGQYLGTGHYLP
jgi:hypothetical protein